MSLSSRLALCLLAFATPVFTAAQEIRCSSGRLFLSSATTAKVYTYDLDSTNPTELNSMDVAAPAMLMYSTGTATNRVAAVYGGDQANNTQGKVQFFRSGLSTDSHGDHIDVVKGTPVKYDFEFTGYKPAHFTASAGFMTVFYDGFWVSGGGGVSQPSSAQFVAEEAFTEDATNGNPTVVTIPVAGGSHHGVAYALSSSAFLVSQPTAARAASTNGAASTPDGFAVYNQVGAITTNLNDRTDENKNCSSAHGAANIGSVYMFGCSSVGVLKVQYDGQNVSSTKLTYPTPVANNVFRSSTIYAQKKNGLFVGNFNNAAVPAVLVPSYTLSFPPNASSPLTSTQLIQTASTTARFCAYAIDQGTPETAGVSLVAYLAEDGKLYVSRVGTDGVQIESSASVQVASSTITCTNYGLIAGFGAMYVINKQVGTLYTINMEKVVEGEAGAVTSITLPYLPAAGVVSTPIGYDCGAIHDHNHGTDTHGAATTSAQVSSVALLVAALVALVADRA